MRTPEFIKNVCVDTFCPYFEYDYGCRAYHDEECDEAFYSKQWRGKTMRERVDEFCEKRLNNKNISKNRYKMNNTKITSISDFEEVFNLRFAEKCCGVCKYGKCEYDGDATCSHPKRNDADEDGVPYLKHNVMQISVCDLWEKRERKKIWFKMDELEKFEKYDEDGEKQI